MKILLIIRFFFSSDKAEIRKTLFFPLLSIFLATFIILITFSIMDGMQNKIVDKIITFEYPYLIKKYNRHEIYNNSMDNYGISRISLLNNSKIIKIKMFNDIDKYLINIQNYIIQSSPNKDNSISIGANLADEFNLNIGDSVELSAITDVNYITGNIVKKNFIVSNIFKFNFMNFDDDFCVISYNDGSKLFDLDNHVNLYFLNKENSLGLLADNKLEKESLITYKAMYHDLLTAMEIEKFFYILIGYLTVLIAGIMIYNNTILTYLEKRRQYSILSIIGLNRKKILYGMLINNNFLVVIFYLLGLLFAYSLIFLNNEYRIMNLIFINMPFDKLPMEISIFRIFESFIFIIFIINFSTLLPYLKYANNDLHSESKQIN